MRDPSIPGAAKSIGALAHPGAPNRRDELPPWRGDPPRAEGLALVGAGLALHGLRPVPLVGRGTERERLWALLDAARATRSPKLGLLVGPAGTGKSRLADWLAVRAHQLGAAVVLRARHSAGGGPGEGLVGMVARHLRCHGLSREELARRLAGLLPGSLPDVVDAREVLQLLLDARASVTLAADDRHAAVRFVLSRLAQRGPVVVVLEDAQWGADALRFAASTLRAGLAAGPVLFVATVRDDLLASLEEPEQLLASLPSGAVERIPVGPLDDASTRALVAGMLRFRGSLADELAIRSAGSPQFAVQLVADWVERDLLEPGPDGFRMRAGAEPRLPTDLQAAWADRVARLAADLPPGGVEAIERAAVLGHEVDREEWSAVCAALSADALAAVEERLLSWRLALPAEDGWTFVHGMLREAVLQAAPEDRVRGHHLAAAAMLATRDAPLRAERVGRHLLAAGRGEDAAPHLLIAADERSRRNDLPAAHRLLDARARALGKGASAAERLAGLRIRTRVLLAQGALDRSLESAEEMLALATSLADDGARCDALLSAAESGAQKGDGEVALVQATDGFALATTLEDGERIGRATTLLAHLADRKGDWETAEKWLLRSVAEAERSDDPISLGGALRILGRARHALGDVDEATALTLRALDVYQAPGGRMGRAHCLNALGEYARSRGEHEEAEAHYRAAIRAYESLGSGLALYPRYNLGLLLVLEGRFDEAWLTLEAAAQQARSAGQRFMVAACEAARLGVAAGRADWAGFDRHLVGTRREFEALGVTEPDFVAVVRRAGALCREAGEGGRAAGATRLAAWMGGLRGA